MNTLTPEENSVLAMMLFDSSENRNIFIIIIIENIKEYQNEIHLPKLILSYAPSLLIHKNEISLLDESCEDGNSKFLMFDTYKLQIH